MVNGKKLLASILVGAMVITGSPVAPAWSVASVEAAEHVCSFDQKTKVIEEYWNSTNTDVSVEYECSCGAIKTVKAAKVENGVIKKATCTTEGESGKIAYYVSGKDINGDDEYKVLATKKVTTIPVKKCDYSKAVKDPSNWICEKNSINGTYDVTVNLTCAYDDCAHKGEVYKVKTEAVPQTPVTVGTCQRTKNYKASITIKDTNNVDRTYDYPDANKTGIIKTIQLNDVHTTRYSNMTVAWVEPTEKELKENLIGLGYLYYERTVTCADCGKTYKLEKVRVNNPKTEAATCVKGYTEVYPVTPVQYTKNVKTANGYTTTFETVTLPEKTVVYKKLADHVPTESVPDNETCKDKYYTRTCANCNETVTITVPASTTKKHTLADGATKTIVPPTCDTKGYTLLSKCAGCGQTNVKIDETDADPSKHVYQVKVDNSLDDVSKVKLVDLICKNCSADLNDKIDNTVVERTELRPSGGNTCQSALKYDIPNDIGGLAAGKTVEVVDVNGNKIYGKHAYEMKYVWANNTTTPKVLVTIACTNPLATDSSKKCSEGTTFTVNGTISDQRLATCTVDGYKKVKATFDMPKLNGEVTTPLGVVVSATGKVSIPVSEIKIDMLGHDYVAPGETVDGKTASANWEGTPSISIPCTRGCNVEGEDPKVVPATIKNIDTNVQELSATFNGKTYKFTRVIGRTTIDATNTVVSGLNEKYAFNGKAQVPELVVKYIKEYRDVPVSGGGTIKDPVYEVLKKDVDYTVDVKDNTNVGKATVTITGIGKYYGTITKTFEITKAELTITTKSVTKTYGDKDNISYVLYNENGDVISNKDVKVEVKREEGEAVGSYKGTISIAETADYKALEDTFAFVIYPREATINIQSATKVAGAADPKFVYTTENVVSGDDLNVALSRDAGETAGKYVIHATFNNPNYNVNVKTGTLTISEATAPAPKAQSITTKKLTASYKVAAVKKAAKTFSIGATCTSKKAVTAKKVSGSKKITVSSTGKVKIAKGTKKGTYTAKVKLSAPKTSSYKAATKTVTVKVTVK